MYSKFSEGSNQIDKEVLSFFGEDLYSHTQSMIQRISHRLSSNNHLVEKYKNILATFGSKIHLYAVY
ncbi:hypothetical protein NADFUDRAFT_68166 [Nadsonia fulvescens var. elongata DSM 6958]|uniref:Uncharacterized protein n=1 Tax=Nadsonia fulvescens var. elongata DSM 6958 TaxID=857566 RepID=A0A1E3PQQ2_9ASCO|nr:hypothetical protein NADFUDRAFT_68166 [Nadsonia fulvescens var. elongata DSM 6958]